MVKIPPKDSFHGSFNEPLWNEIARSICQSNSISCDALSRAAGTDNIVYFVGSGFILKIFTPAKNGFNREKSGLEFVVGKPGIRFPEIVATGEFEYLNYLIMTRITGGLVTRMEWHKIHRKDQIQLVQQLARGLAELHDPDPIGIDFCWEEFISAQADSVMDRQRESGATDEWLKELPNYMNDNIDLLPRDPRPSFMHGDVHFGNLGVAYVNGSPTIAGMFDLADCLSGFHEYEFVAPGVLMIQGQGELQREFFRAYGYPEHAIDEELRTRLMLLTILYETSGLRRYAERLRPEAVNYSLYELERAIWNFI